MYERPNPRLGMSDDFCMVAIAMWASQGWAALHERWRDSEKPLRRSHALYARTRAVVFHDRVLNGRLD